MTIYLTIITTILVITQVIRITQNAVSLHRQNKEIKQCINRLGDVTNEDLETQRKAYRLIVERLEGADNEQRAD